MDGSYGIQPSDKSFHYISAKGVGVNEILVYTIGTYMTIFRIS